MKIHQIPHVIFKATSQFFFKLCISLQCHGRSLFCTFLVETLYDLGKRSPSKGKNSNFWLLREISPNLYFDRLLLLKVNKYWAKIVQRSYVSWHWRMMQNLKRNGLSVSTLTWGIRRILTQALESLNNLHFNGLFLTKVYNAWAKYRRVMFNSTEDWCKIWRKTDWCFHMSNLANFRKLKKSNFILEITMAELNKKRKENSKQADQPDVVWKRYFGKHYLIAQLTNLSTHALQSQCS